MATRSKQTRDKYTIHLKKRLEKAYKEGVKKGIDISSRVSWSGVAFTITLVIATFVAGYIWGLNN